MISSRYSLHPRQWLVAACFIALLDHFTRVDTELDLLVLPPGYTLQVQEYLQ
ncbi:hypothetical protein NIES4072_05590 [Nostoc commune NIES-4072]|uniref:Uncharacterized protein n=1 Tax=Nostoc commune NIES-4072 TaxID=2005467 RepID=A0A2R5FKZ0_NOSCO|nr:hypothetical protein NIES4072_05590 [Nostoc commune NIES-4072]